MTTPSQAGPAPDPQALAKRLELSFRVGQILGPDYDGVSFDDVARELVQVKADLAAVRAQLEESIHSPVLQAVLDACSGKLDPSTQIADHPNVKFAQMERLKLKAALTALRAQLQANTNEYIEVVHDQGVKLMQAEAALAELRAREFVKKCDALPPTGTGAREVKATASAHAWNGDEWAMPRNVLVGLAGDDPQKQELLAAWDLENELRHTAESENEALRAQLEQPSVTEATFEERIQQVRAMRAGYGPETYSAAYWDGYEQGLLFYKSDLLRARLALPTQAQEKVE